MKISKNLTDVPEEGVDDNKLEGAGVLGEVTTRLVGGGVLSHCDNMVC